MSNSTVRASLLLVGSIILLAALYVHPSQSLFGMIVLHALAVSIPSSLGFVLHELDVDSFRNILSMLAVFAFGTAIAGLFLSLAVSAGILFVALSVAFIIGMTYWV